MRGEGMSFSQALEYVRSKRKMVCPNYGFQAELKKYSALLDNLRSQSKNDKEKH
jgi:hypothetical protein